MTSHAEGVSIRQLLFNHGGSAEEELTRVAADKARGRGLSTAVSGLTPTGADLVGTELGRIAAEFLDMDVTDALAAGWAKHRQLAEAREETASSPGSEAVVSLATHTIRSDYRPAVDVLVDGAKVTTVEIHISLTTKVDSAVAIVRNGQVTAVQAGAADLTAALKCEGVTVAERSTSIDLPKALRLPLASAALARHPDESHAQVEHPALNAAVPPPDAAAAPTPLGLVQNGWRYLGSGRWEPVQQHKPGDIVNGYRLNESGTAWDPLASGSQHG